MEPRAGQVGTGASEVEALRKEDWSAADAVRTEGGVSGHRPGLSGLTSRVPAVTLIKLHVTHTFFILHSTYTQTKTGKSRKF